MEVFSRNCGLFPIASADDADRWEVLMKFRSSLEYLFRISGLCLAASAVIFMSVPTVSEWKKVAGVACAVFGTVFLVLMYFAKKEANSREVQMANRELTHYPSVSNTGHDVQHDTHTDFDQDH